jgi:hypothetical protein
MIAAAGPAVRIPRCAAALVAALVALGVPAGCGGDDDAEPDPEAFCDLGPAAVPVEDASPEVLETLAAVAPERLRADVEVLREAAERLADFDEGDPDALEAEFEIRFDPEYAAARDAVEAAVARCPRPFGGTGADGTGPTTTELPTDELPTDELPTDQEDTP